ncbi:MAG TPA: hypothetical protein VKW78_23160 [Terriglobales bacterium]|nr:hypothetical protein [Terriglobales bacterium]
MAEPDKQLSLSDGTVRLYTNVKFLEGTKEICSGDHMIVQHVTGRDEDVVILREDGKATVKRIVLKMEFPSGRGGVSFADLDAKDVERLLAIYKLVNES